MRAYPNPTPAQLRAREKARRYAQRARQRALEAANRGATTCQRRQGAGTCGGRIEAVIDRVSGQTAYRCPRCVRRVAGICADCSRPVEGRRGSAIRCAGCKVTARQRAEARHRDRYRAEINRRQRDRVRKLPADKKRNRLAYKKAWRRANPEKVQAYKARERAQRQAKILAYHRAYRAQHRAELAAKARAAYYAKRPVLEVPPCVQCGGPITYAPPGRPKKRCDACVPPSIRARRRQETPAWERPVVERPLRTCVVRGCDIVVTHQAKKCPKCKAKHALTARALIASRRAA